MSEHQQLNSELEAYSEWRSKLSEAVQALSGFLRAKQVTDLRTHHQFELVLGALADDNLSVAFVAEFSRGKSEMINSIFFADHKQRMLPSGAGRTTMCPTELLYDRNRPPCIRLLPIETRKDQRPLHEIKQDESQWVEIGFDPQDSQATAEALARMTDSKLVSKQYAEDLRFSLKQDNEHDSDSGLPLNQYDEVEIPTWRHAVINLPHPMLEQGLVILDTPGLNAIGSEPELTIDQLAAAHAVVFILSHDTGVTQSDLTLWERHLCGTQKAKDAKTVVQRNQRRLVALNKIDALWDGIRSDVEVQAELDRQVWNTAKTLGIDPGNIYPVSAQKGLLGRLRNDPELIERSRIQDLESAIAHRLIPQKRSIVVDKVRSAVEEILDTAGSIIESRRQDTGAHIKELQQISVKNTDVISHIMSKVTSEKSSLESDMQRYQALRSVYNKESGRLTHTLSRDRLERTIAKTRHNMSRCASSITLQKTITKYFETLHRYLDHAMYQANEIAALCENITRDYEQEHGISNFSIRRLRLEKFKREVQRLEKKHHHLQETKTLFFKEQMSITNRFYDSVCAASKAIFERALRETRDWTENLMVPMETYVREHHSQLRRRLESVKRIHRATDTVETRLAELKQQETELIESQKEFNTLQADLARLLIESSPGDLGDDQAKSDSNILYWNHSINF